MRNKILLLLLVIIVSAVTIGCEEAETVSRDVSYDADNFKVLRKLQVINTRTDKTEFEMIGVFSLQDGSRKEINIICKTGKNQYKKHIIGLNEDSIYLIEDLGSADNTYQYEVYSPEQIELEPTKKE